MQPKLTQKALGYRLSGFLLHHLVELVKSMIFLSLGLCLCQFSNCSKFNKGVRVIGVVEETSLSRSFYRSVHG